MIELSRIVGIEIYQRCHLINTIFVLCRPNSLQGFELGVDRNTRIFCTCRVTCRVYLVLTSKTIFIFCDDSTKYSDGDATRGHGRGQQRSNVSV